MNKIVYNVNEVAKMLDVSNTTVYQMVHNHKIPYVFVNKRIFIPIKQFDLWFEESISNNEHPKKR